METSYEKLNHEAVNTNFEGWDFSFITDSGRMKEEQFIWSYENIVKGYFPVQKMLDMGTGGGEVLSSLAPLPQKTFAIESYIPNVDVAKRRLTPLGVNVVYVPENPHPPYNDNLPFEDNFFDLIINRHEAYYPNELKRILKEKGYFITQQVGFLTVSNLLKDMLGDKAYYGNWNLQSAVNELVNEDFSIIKKEEQITYINFLDYNV